MNSKQRLVASLATAVSVLMLDIAAKIAAFERFETRSFELFPGLELRSTRNTGIAFSLLEGQKVLIFLLGLLAICGLIVYLLKFDNSRFGWLSIGMMLGGALGNGYDRVQLGFVRDFIDPAKFPAFNVADSFITVGVSLLALEILWPSTADSQDIPVESEPNGWQDEPQVPE